jgi:UDP-glucose 4-epimerase
MKALVTGGAGFIGSALVDRLLAEGHDVDVIDDLSTGSLSNLAEARTNPAGKVTFHQLDVRSADVAPLIVRRHPEVVFHLAGVADEQESLIDPAGDTEVTVIGMVRVLEGARQAGSRKVVFASSAAIYGDPDHGSLPAKESQPRQPVTPHGAAKNAAESYLSTYRVMYDIEYTSLALANVYGPRQTRRAGQGRPVVASFVECMLAGDACTVTGNGEQRRDFVYVDDAVDALARAAEKGSGLLCNIGTGRATSVNRLHQLMAEASGSSRAALNAPARLRERERSALDASRAALHLGWRPWTPLEEGVAATFEWHRRR